MREYIVNWFDLRENTLLKLKENLLVDLIEKARLKGGTLNKAINAMGLTYPSFLYVLQGKAKMVSVRKLRVICDYLSINPLDLNSKIVETRKGTKASIRDPKFPIDLCSAEGAYLLGSINSDGTIYIDKKSRGVYRTRYSSSDQESIELFSEKLKAVFGEVYVQYSKERGNTALTIGSSIIGEALVKAGAHLGNKTDENASLPWIIGNNLFLAPHYLNASFGDEGSIAGGKNYFPYVILTRYSNLDTVLNKTEREFILKEIVPLMKERYFPTGHLTRSISFPKIKDCLGERIYLKIFEFGQSKLLLDEAELLKRLGIDSRIHLNRLSQTEKGRLRISTSLFVSKKKSIVKFYKDVGFSLTRKQEKLAQALREVNWISNDANIQHINKEKRNFQSKN